MPAPPRRFDVFCRVVDNFGDAGVALRLSRQLADEHGADVTLWIDDATALSRLLGAVVVNDRDIHEGVRVRALAEMERGMECAQVVVETFGCGLPERYLDAMERAPRPPVWIVLEYLTAEPWIDSAHALPSPHPARALRRWFLFPGFSVSSGGLLRERGLVAQCRRTKDDARARAAAWTSLGFPSPSPDALVVSLFCYPNAALPALLDAWRGGQRPVACIVPEGVATSDVAAVTGQAPSAGMLATKHALTVAVAPFVHHQAFDRRLAASDVCFVRGEDSFVRAQWAQKPFVWHVYPQAAGAHEVKLKAFVDRFAEHLDGATAAALRDFWLAFNAGDGAATVDAWPRFSQALGALRLHAEAWAEALSQQRDLATQLVGFANDRL